jgi:hypothetical protein
MAIRYPEETEAGFTVQDWEGFNQDLRNWHSAIAIL